jgi:hypothetical protein
MMSPQTLATVWAPAGLDMLVAATCSVARPGYYSEWRCAKAERRASRRAARMQRRAARMQRRAAWRQGAGPAPVLQEEPYAVMAPEASFAARTSPVAQAYPTAALYEPASDAPLGALVVAKAEAL